MKTQTTGLQDVISKAKSLWNKLIIKPKKVENDDEIEHTVSQNHEIIDSNHVRSMSFIFWFAGVIVVYV